MSTPTNAERIEAFIAEHMPEVVLSDWQRDFIRQMFIDGCICPPITADSFGRTSRTYRGWNPACKVHQRHTHVIRSESGPELDVPKASGGIIKPNTLLIGGRDVTEHLASPPRLSGGPAGGPRPYPMDPNEKVCFPDGTVKTVREMVGKPKPDHRTFLRWYRDQEELVQLAVWLSGILAVLGPIVLIAELTK